MRIYFLSSQPAALYVGGVYFGQVFDFERYAELSLRDGIPVRLECEGMHPLHFFLDEKLPLRPPKGVSVYRLPEGLALHCDGFVPTDDSLKIIAQKRQGEVLATVCAQGGLRLIIDTPKGVFNATLPPSFSICELFFFGENIGVKSAEQIGVFSPSCQPLLLESYLAADCGETELALTIPLSDRYKRTAECRYALTENGLKRTSYRLKQAEEIPVDGLIAYAFFESARIGADLTPFLCEDLQGSAQTVLDFLGDFIYVLPTEEPTKCLLVYQKAERLFDVRTFTVQLKEGAITDVVG